MVFIAVVKLFLHTLQTGDVQVWTRPVTPVGSVAFALVNFGYRGTPTRVSVTIRSLGLTFSGGYNITDLFDGRHLGIFKPSETFTTMVNPSGVFLAAATPLRSSA